MAVSSDSIQTPLISELVRGAYLKAGLLSVYEQLDEPRAAEGRRLLSEYVANMHSRGYLMRVEDEESVTLQANVSEYSLGSNVLHPIGVAMWHQTATGVTGYSDAETQVHPETTEAWQMRPSKSSTGRPSLYSVWRSQDPVRVRFWPIPDAAGAVRFRVHRLRAKHTDGSADPDFERYWDRVLEYAVAMELAEENSMPMAKIATLERRLKEMEQYAIQHAQEPFPTRMVVRHRTPWSR